MSQLTIARLGLGAFLLAAAVAAAAVAGVRLGLLPYAQGWRLMLPATGLGLAGAALGLFWLGRALKANTSAGRGMGLVALFGSALLLYPPLGTMAHRLTAPPIHDFTTDTEYPPRFAALLKLRGPHANPPEFDGGAPVRFDGKQVTLSEVLHDHYVDVLKPHAGFAIGSKNPIATFFWRNFEAVKKTGWTLVAYSEQDARIEATTRSFWFGRPYDIVIQVRRAGAGARTDLRVQNRYDAVDDGFGGALAKSYFKLLAER
jgi:fatty-acyl-CoA synthase